MLCYSVQGLVEPCNVSKSQFVMWTLDFVVRNVVLIGNIVYT